VAWRNRRATILRLIAPFLFLLLALLIDKALQANDRNSQAFQDQPNPTPELIGDIPSCHDDLYIGDRPCQELLYSPNNTLSNAIMANVTTRNKIKITATGYRTQDEVNQYLLANTDSVIAAVHFIFDDINKEDTLNGFLLQTNTTVKVFKGDVQDPNKFVQLPVQSAVQRELARYFLSKNPATKPAADNLSWNLYVQVFAHPAIATVSVLGQVLGPFVFAAAMFSFVSQIGFLVSERELGLRQALRTMGMTEAAYWLSWAAWEFTMAFVLGHLICCYGLLLQFRLFLDNSYGLLFFLFFLFLLAMSSLAMFICSFIKKTTIAVYVGFAVFLIGWIMQTVVIFGVPYTPDFYDTLNWALTCIFSMLPWTTLAKGFSDLGAATVSDSSPGLRWSERKSYCLNIPNREDQFSYNPREQYISFKCVMPLNTIYWLYVALWAGFLVLAIYVDNILPNEFNVRRSPWYFLMPSYWIPSLSKGNGLGKLDDSHRAPGDTGATDEDVAAEESKVRSLLNHRTGKAGELASFVEQRNAVEVFGLQKVFPPSGGCAGTCCFCCYSESSPGAFWAIKGSWFTIAENQLFCLLGPNGAGKSTTINCLTGVLPPSHGEALVYGQAISSVAGMDKIRSMMGVCPQFDVLWGELNGREHLQLYASVKGISWRDVVDESATLLEKVKLTYAAGQRTSAYSGGMKRRLSVAIALLGDPKIVYLDEPTTGMDPISRRYVWDIIQEAKVGRAIVLTTHSMEEADILGDRIAIMAKGKLRCIGTSLRLKQKFGSGYQVAVSVVPPRGSQADLQMVAARADNIKQYFRERLGEEPVEEGRVYIHYLIPRNKEAELIPFLKELEQQAAQLGITDVQLSLTSLEEVFLNIAKTAEIEEARNTNQKPMDVPLPDGTILKVPLGMELVTNPATNISYKIKWSTDENGNLCVLDTTPLDATQLAAAIATQGGASSAPVAAPQHPGTVEVRLPDGTSMLVPLNTPYVMNPLTNQPYQVTWGNQGGKPVVLSCVPYTPPGGVQMTPQHTNGAHSQPVMQDAPMQPANYFDGNGRPVGEGSLQIPLPGSMPSTSSNHK